MGHRIKSKLLSYYSLFLPLLLIPLLFRWVVADQRTISLTFSHYETPRICLYIEESYNSADIKRIFLRHRHRRDAQTEKEWSWQGGRLAFRGLEFFPQAWIQGRTRALETRDKEQRQMKAPPWWKYSIVGSNWPKTLTFVLSTSSSERTTSTVLVTWTTPFSLIAGEVHSHPAI